MTNNNNLEVNSMVIINKLLNQIKDLTLQIAILQTQVEMLMQKSVQYVTPNTQLTPKQDNKPTIQSEIEPNLAEHNIENISE